MPTRTPTRFCTSFSLQGRKAWFLSQWSRSSRPSRSHAGPPPATAAATTSVPLNRFLLHVNTYYRGKGRWRVVLLRITLTVFSKAPGEVAAQTATSARPGTPFVSPHECLHVPWDTTTGIESSAAAAGPPPSPLPKRQRRAG
ncbi:uncharacterized protein LOC144224157 [Crocuta crocuta]